MYKKILLSTLGGAIVLFLLGGLIYMVLFPDMMKEYQAMGAACMKTEMNLGLIFSATFVQALLTALVLDKFGISTLQSGALAAAWLTFLIVLWFDLWMFTTFSFYTLNLLVVDIIINTIMGAIGGGVIGWILGKVK